MYRQRFGLSHDPLPRDARGKTFFDKVPSYQRLRREHLHLIRDPGLAVLTGPAGCGKTAALRNLCDQLPVPDHQVLYIADTAVSPLDLYRTMAYELGVAASHRRSQLWTDIKKTLAHMVDERSTLPVIVIDEAQHLSDRFLIDLSGFLNFAFDSRDLLVMWLVGLPSLWAHLRMQHHSPLAMRVQTHVTFEPIPDRDTFVAMIDHALKAAGAQNKLMSDPATELLWRHSRGLPRQASKILRAALIRADEHDQNFVDDTLMEQVIDDMAPPAARATP